MIRGISQHMNYLIVGLGNPGEKYKQTRHNVGWILIDSMFPTVSWKKNSYANALVATAEISDGLTMQLVKPLTFMNESGDSVEYFIKKEEILPEHIIVIYDDIDLRIGKIKISFDRGSGGHNGIKSIESHVGSREFIRVRVGISKMLESGELIKPNVLGNFESDETEVLGAVAKKVASALGVIAREGKEKAMTEFNK